MSYEILRHSADEKFRAEGESLEEAFKEATKAFSEIVKSGTGSTRHEIEVETEGYEALLFDYLDKLILLQDTEGVAVSRTEKIQIEDKEDSYQLKAEVMTETISPGINYTDIKAPTYNEMKVDHQDGKWVLEAVLDI